MKPMARTFGILTMVMLIGGSLLVAQDKSPEKKDKPTHPGFEKLKTLAGEWLRAAPPAGEQAENQDANQVQVVYKVTAAGSVVHETLFPGTPHEMVTVYYMDGADLVLVHYCAAGNQPRMKAAPALDGDQLVFKFAGGTNIDPAKDAHMHDLTITFKDAHHIRAAWSHYADGKPGEPTVFEFQRKK